MLCHFCLSPLSNIHSNNLIWGCYRFQMFIVFFFLSPSLYFPSFILYRNAYVSKQSITDVSIQKISETCTNLQKLCVSKCVELTDHTLTSLAQHNPLLNTLEVAGCHQFTDLGFQALGKVSFEFHLNLCRSELN